MSTTIHWSLRRGDLFYSDQLITKLPHTSCFLCRHFVPTNTDGGVIDDMTQYWGFEKARKSQGRCEKLIVAAQVHALEDNCADFQPMDPPDKPTHEYFALHMRNIEMQNAWEALSALKKALKAEKEKSRQLRKRIIEINAKNRKKADAKAGL